MITNELGLNYESLQTIYILQQYSLIICLFNRNRSLIVVTVEYIGIISKIVLSSQTSRIHRLDIIF